MIRRSLGQIAAMCRGRTDHPHVTIAGVSTDTRTLQPGNLYVPLSGQRVDGHRFVEQAIKSGAAGTLWSVEQPELPPPDCPAVLVEDTLIALQQLAAAYRRQIPATVIGITGSNGKTSVKDLLIAILSAKYRTQGTAGNLNSEVGLPLTLLSLSEDVEMAVVEMGMSGLGEIELLSKLASPELAVITSIGEAHLADLGSLEKIAQAKLEILQGLKPGGRFIANGDCHLLDAAIEQHSATTFGAGKHNDFHPTAIEWRGDTMAFRINQAEGQEFLLPMPGRHQVINALAAIAAARQLQLSYDDIRRGMQAVCATGMRGELLRSGNVTIINDTYKSNPPSVLAALDSLYALSGYGKKIAVLGDMRDLGEDEARLHGIVGEHLDPGQLHTIITVGDAASQIARVARRSFPRDRVFELESKEEVLELLGRQIGLEPVLLLVKGARALAMNELVAAIAKE